MTEVDPDGPFGDLRRALRRLPDDQEEGLRSGPRVRADPNRQRRTGIPEVVHAENKPAGDVADALRRLVAAHGRALASRLPEASVAEIRSALEPELVVEEHRPARALVACRPGWPRPARSGRIGVLSAGTSDVPVAMEAALMAEEMGSRVLTAWDVGVAGLHRLVEPLERFAAEDVDAIVVAAGMDGALPSVVAGLVDVPVIGLPTAIGYGFGAAGVGALTTMLQSCAPGLVVVNIDNGIGAGATAALIANRAASGRGSGGS
jgi:pyridinium-3,5-biscarboxylic acid mononucleotide synthase